MPHVGNWEAGKLLKIDGIYFQQFPCYSNSKCKIIAVFTLPSTNMRFGAGT